MSDKIIRVPPEKYRLASDLQKKIVREMGYSPPLWWCLLEVEKPYHTGKAEARDPFDQFRRLRL